MRVGLPTCSVRLAERMVVFYPTAADMERSSLWWWPWLHEPSSGGFLCHVSSVAYLRRLPGWRGYVSPEARAAVLDYSREAVASFRGRFAPSSGFDWASVLSPAWVPKDYQRAGMDRLWARAFGPSPFGSALTGGSLLGDDTGLGKTVQAIAVVVRAFREGLLRGRCVIVSTTSSMKGQWADEFEKFSRFRVPLVVVDGGREERCSRLGDVSARVLVVNYEIARLPQYRSAWAGALRRCGLLVLDETSKVANPASGLYSAFSLAARSVGRVISFNASPVERSPLDIMSQVSLVDSRVLGSLPLADGRYVSRDRYGGCRAVMNIPELRLRLAGCYFRRTAVEVRLELPPLVAEIRRVGMSPAEARAYRLALGDFASGKTAGAVGLARLGAVQFAALCSDISDLRAPSAKLDDLVSLLDGELSGEKVVVFSRFATVARYVAARLARYRPFLVCGDTPQADRSTFVRRFSLERGSRLFIGTEAADRGLNLQAASVVVNLDIPWTGGRLAQRVGRCLRFGQRASRVLVLNYSSSCPGSPGIDDYMLGKVLARREMTDFVVGSDGVDKLGADGEEFARLIKQGRSR